MPKIDLSGIPGLDTAQALFGAVMERAGGDDIVDIMVYVYDTAPPPPPGIF